VIAAWEKFPVSRGNGQETEGAGSMPDWIRTYVRWVEAVNHRVGRFTMYLLFVIMAVMLWSSASKVAHLPANWTLETAQFLFVAYYLLGAPYSMQLDSNVRMDLLYGRMSPRTQVLWDVFTIFVLMFYIGVMLYGAVESTAYSISINERNPTAWRPPLWPIKLITCIAFFLLLLQCTAHFFRDLETLRRKTA
jgi:TRAP-type mannitol/chloroaromatic compound transport system permease small subunit